MTVSSQTSRIDYAGDGVTAIFPVPFYFLENTHLKVILSDDATGAETVLLLNTDYTVTGAGVLSGGSITVPSEPAVGFTLTILRSVPVTQETDYVPNDPFPAESHERALDKLTMIIQQQSTDSAGAIKVAVSDPEPARLAPAVSRANQLMGFDSQGNPIAVAPVSGDAADLALSLANNTDPAKGAGQVGYKSRTVFDRLEDLDDIVTVTTAANLQSAINANPAVWVPSGVVLDVVNITIPSNKLLVIDGTLRMPTNSPDGSVIIKNSDQIGGNSNIRVTGAGTLDGNKANQVGATTKHGLVHFKLCTNAHFSVSKVNGNYFPLAISSTETTGAVLFESCEDSSLSDSDGSDYGRECFWMKLCNNSRMFNLRAYGGTDSWSGMQFSGDYNSAYGWYVENAGASGCSFDCRYSTLDDVVSKDNRFFHGINFGHAGIPADESVATNLIASGGSKEGTGNICNGISVAANTTGLTLMNALCKGAPDNGLQVSDGADRITVIGLRASGNGANGAKFFGDATKSHSLSEATLTGNTLVGLRVDGGMQIDVIGSDTRGNTGGGFGADGSSVLTFSTTRIGTDALFGSQSIASLAAGSNVVVTNNNATTSSRIIVQPSNAAGSAAKPFLLTLGSGSFTIQLELASGGGAFVRWWIL